MGFFSDLMTDIFGGSDKGEIRAQREENVRVREDLARLTGQAENAIGTYLPIADERMRQGLVQSADVLRQTPQAQMQALQGYGMQADDAILSGMDAYKRALLGIPGGSFQPMQNVQGLSNPFQAQNPASWGESTLPGRPGQTAQPLDVAQFLSGMRLF